MLVIGVALMPYSVFVFVVFRDGNDDVVSTAGPFVIGWGCGGGGCLLLVEGRDRCRLHKYCSGRVDDVVGRLAELTSSLAWGILRVHRGLPATTLEHGAKIGIAEELKRYVMALVRIYAYTKM